MAISFGTITFDTTDARALAAWWAERTGAPVVFDAEGEYVLGAGQGQVGLAFQRVDEPTPGKNRVHLDLTTTDLDAEVAGFVAAGAEVVGEYTEPFRWVTLSDPDGNVFCIADHAAAGATLL